MNFRIVTQDNCPWCERAKTLLAERGYTYDEVRLETLTETVRDAFKSRFRTVPQVYHDGDRIGGCDDLEKWLAGRGD